MVMTQYPVLLNHNAAEDQNNFQLAKLKKIPRPQRKNR
jgi:hypothetical protein